MLCLTVEPTTICCGQMALNRHKVTKKRDGLKFAVNSIGPIGLMGPIGIGPMRPIGPIKTRQTQSLGFGLDFQPDLVNMRAEEELNCTLLVSERKPP